MNKLKSNLVGIISYLCATLFTLITLLISTRFKFKISHHFGGYYTSLAVDIILYLILLLPFFFIGKQLCKKKLIRLKSMPFLIFLGVLILIPLIDVIFLKDILLSIIAFPLGFGLGFSDATAWATSYSIYAILVTSIYFTKKK